MKSLYWVGHEVRLQFKNGLYGIYILVNLIYIFLLGYVPEAYSDFVVTMIIFSDPTVLGMVFVGAFILLEKVDGITQGIGVSPLGASNYVLGKALSMVIISVLTALVVSLFTLNHSINVVGLSIAVAIGSMIFTMLGIIIGIYSKTVNEYLMTIIGGSIVLIIPLLQALQIVDINILKIIPTYGIYKFIEASIEGSKLNVPHLIYLLIWMGIMYMVSKNRVTEVLFRR